jgi:hypothetical protein
MALSSGLDLQSGFFWIPAIDDVVAFQNDVSRLMTLCIIMDVTAVPKRPDYLPLAQTSPQPQFHGAQQR